MAKRIRRINYRERYPEASDAVIEVLEKSDRKMEYQQYDLKVERYHIDCVSCAITLIPSREDSFERLEDSNHQFASDEISVEDAAVQAVLIEKMLACLKMLTPKEQELIKELFFKGKSEHQISREINIAQRTIHDRKVRILSKLKKLMEN